MSAYVIAIVKVTNPERYAQYVKLTPATVVPYGARFIARGGRAETLEGAIDANRIVVLEFENYERAKDWYESEGYSHAKAIRQSASIASLLLVDGVPK